MQGVMLTRVTGGLYCSYETHNWCKNCERWRSKNEDKCNVCNGRLRKRPRTKTKKFKETQWLKAY